MFFLRIYWVTRIGRGRICNKIERNVINYSYLWSSRDFRASALGFGELGPPRGPIAKSEGFLFFFFFFYLKYISFYSNKRF